MKTLLVYSLAMALLGCGAGGKGTAGPEDSALADCAADHARSMSASDDKEVSAKLDAYLQQSLMRWRLDLGAARCRGDGSAIANIESRRLSVLVDYAGDKSALESAGLSAGYDEGGTISGIIELRRVHELAAVGEVHAIREQPQVQTN